MPDRNRTIFAVVPAAGSSSRFGSTKQTVELDGIPLIQRAFETASRVCGDRVVTVLGHDATSVLAAMRADTGFIVVNDDYEDGLGSSISAAARVCRPHAAALLLLLADQVLVTAEHLRALVHSWSGSGDEIIATAYDETLGPPVLFPRNTLDDLCALRGDTGARALLDDKRFQLQSVRFDPAAIDIDTPADLASLT